MGEEDGGHLSVFAKLSGQDWTYYVKRTSIKIGRPPDRSRGGEGDHSPAKGKPGADEDADVHIDLGPSKHVSRLHAQVYYDSITCQWNIEVTGRNGAHLDDKILKKGESAVLESGAVIEIAGTEMMFVTVDDAEGKIHPKYLARINWPGLEREREESDIGGQLHSHPKSATFDYPPPPIQAPVWVAQNPSIPSPMKRSRPSTPVQSPRLDHNYLAPADGDSIAASSLPRKSNGEIDYSVDAARNIKPPCSYATLIAQAILSTPDKALALAGIYDWIKENFSYYRYIEQTWQVCYLSLYHRDFLSQTDFFQNSIRHNLSLSQSFQKVARRTDEPGKGMKWYIVPSKVKEFEDKGLETSTRGGVRQSSGPNTPDKKKSPPRKGLKARSPRTEMANGTNVFKSSPNPQTSPLSAYAPPAAQEAYTPSRGGSRIPNLLPTPLPVFSDDASPLLGHTRHFNGGTLAAGSPPSLSSTAAYYENVHNLRTPAPQKTEPRPWIPSTAKLPSQYLPQSSPYPDWMQKFNGSTPARFPESSPVKDSRGNGFRPNLQSSSPPQAIATGSPTKARNIPLQFPSSSQANGSKFESGHLGNGFAASNGVSPKQESNDREFDLGSGDADEDDFGPIDILQ